MGLVTRNSIISYVFAKGDENEETSRAKERRERSRRESALVRSHIFQTTLFSSIWVIALLPLRSGKIYHWSFALTRVNRCVIYMRACVHACVRLRITSI